MFIRYPNRFIRYTVVLLLAVAAEASAQSWDMYVNVGYASYSHPELRTYQEYFQRELLVQGEATETFPSYLTYAIGAHKNWNSWNLGLELGHGSTGGRIYYEDYSGKLIADQLVYYSYVGITPSVALNKSDKFRVMAGLKLSLILHNLEINNKLTVWDETVSEQVYFESVNLGFQPHVRVRWSFGSRFFVDGCAGYELQSRGETYAPDENGAYLADENSEAVHLQGSGFRLSIGAGVKF